MFFARIPNPTKGKITILGGEENERLVTTVFDITGKYLLNEFTLTSSQREIDLSGLSAGVYIVTIRGEQGSIKRVKLIKTE
jgi:hypothetical protein